MVFVTLFDSFYLDKGLVMYDSLVEVTSEFKLYVIAFDDRCYDVLKSMHKDNLIPVSMKDFESDELLQVKPYRTRAEYCWTCSSFAIAFILDQYEEMCTYIDADLFFYDDPIILLEEMKRSNCDVQIIEQRFDNRILSQQMMKRSGKYCVEFNTFTNSRNSRKILRWWENRVIECCTVSADGRIFGDQKYLDDWVERFQSVHVVENVGAGIAPWNITNYELIDKIDGKVAVRYKLNNQCVPLVFYHFHNVTYISAHKVNIEVYNRAWTTSKELVEAVYFPYIKKIEEKRCLLSTRYGINYSARESHPTSIISILKNSTVKEVLKKLKGYSFVGLLQFIVYQRNHKLDIIDTSQINV